MIRNTLNFLGLRFVVVLSVAIGSQTAAMASVQFDIGSNGTLNGATGNRFVIGSGYGVDSMENGGTLLDVLFVVNPSLPSLAPFNLLPTQFANFLFGTITFREPNTGAGGNLGIRGQETDNLGVTAYLTFDLPPLTPDAALSTVGVPVTGTISDSDVDFSITFPTVLVDFGPSLSGQFSVALSAVSFTNTPQSQDVTATLTLIREPVTSTPPNGTPGGDLQAPEAASAAIWLLLACSASAYSSRRRS